VAEHDADREPQPIDEDAAWAAIVAGYGDEPSDPPGAKPFKTADGLALLEGGRNTTEARAEKTDTAEEGPEPEADRPAAGQDKGQDDVKPTLGGSVVFAPGVRGFTPAGPRDYTAPETGASPDEDDEDDEGHFVPPEPPPLPESDVTAKFAWLAVIGGPVLLLVAVLLQWEMTWWLTTISIGGFLGGFATLVARMQNDDDENDDPGRGAVV
jgi:hypothetical protein